MPRGPVLDLIVIGPGLVGKALLSQLVGHPAFASGAVPAHEGLALRVVAVANSTAIVEEVNFSDAGWTEHLDQRLAEAGKAGGGGSVLSHVSTLVAVACTREHNICVVDCTASAKVASHYERWLEAGASVVTPNKKANSGRLSDYQKLKAIQRESHTHYFYEATVGAGLPILSTLQNLLATGDKVKQIEGVFSGTLSYIFNSFGASKKFSDVVAEAKALGYTEPDPRDDLDGMDVARKVCILARECGIQILDVDLIAKRSLVPDELEAAASIDEFMAELPKYDSWIAAEAEEAATEGKVLRFVGVVDVENSRTSVELRKYDKTHAFATLQGSDNMVSFRTARYDSNPLIVRGPGAGAEVTAAGVFCDILAVARRLGAKI